MYSLKNLIFVFMSPLALPYVHLYLLLKFSQEYTWYLIFSVTVIPQLDFPGMKKINVSQKSQTTSKLYFSASKTLINVKLPFLLKADVKHCNDLGMKFVVYVRSKITGQSWGGNKTTHTYSRKTVQSMAKRACEHHCNPSERTLILFPVLQNLKQCANYP